MVSLTLTDVAHVDTPSTLRLATPIQTRVYEVTGVAPEQVPAKLAGLAEIPYEQPPPLNVPQKWLVEWRRIRYWDDTLAAPLPFTQPGTAHVRSGRQLDRYLDVRGLGTSRDLALK
jgi:hypothetical protein